MPPDQQRSAAAEDARHRAYIEQRIQDARAALNESWNGYGREIESIFIGYKCSVVDRLSADVAVQHIESAMDEQKAQVGLIGDDATNIKAYANSWIDRGKKAVASGACAHLTAAERGHLRTLVASLM
jgi:hypothetical protein